MFWGSLVSIFALDSEFVWVFTLSVAVQPTDDIVIVWLELEANNIQSTGFTVDKQTALIYDGYVEPSEDWTVYAS